jgi:hypothetical protein
MSCVRNKECGFAGIAWMNAWMRGHPRIVESGGQTCKLSPLSYLHVCGRYLSHFVIPDIFYRESIFSLCQLFNTALAVPRTSESEKIQQVLKNTHFPLTYFVG